MEDKISELKLYRVMCKKAQVVSDYIVCFPAV